MKFYLGISGQFRATKYNESIKKEIDLRPIIRAVVEKHRYQNLIINETQFVHDFYDAVMREISEKLRNYIDIENGAGSITTECKGFDFSITLGDDFKIATDKETQKEIIEIKLQGS